MYVAEVNPTNSKKDITTTWCEINSPPPPKESPVSDVLFS